jgi:pyrimidine deaminase RibD-like protein
MGFSTDQSREGDCKPANLAASSVHQQNDLDMTLPQDREYLLLALEEAKKCTPISTAYCVGCVIVNPATSTVLATGYSRELPGNTHAEENALAKLASQERLTGLDLYATMEPCSERLSGNKPCTDRILEAGGLIRRVVLGVREPDKFVKCVGVEKLQSHGVEVIRNEDAKLEKECLDVAKRGH